MISVHLAVLVVQMQTLARFCSQRRPLGPHLTQPTHGPHSAHLASGLRRNVLAHVNRTAERFPWLLLPSKMSPLCKPEDQNQTTVSVQTCHSTKQIPRINFPKYVISISTRKFPGINFVFQLGDVNWTILGELPLGFVLGCHSVFWR